MFGHRHKAPEPVAPGPTYMSKQQMGSFLQDLRSSRPARPTGARPPPASFASNRQSLSRVPSRLSVDDTNVSVISEDNPAEIPDLTRVQSAASHNATTKGTPIIRSPSLAPQIELDTDVLRERRSYQDIPYMERGSRWMEKQEARSLRQALEQVDLEAEQKLHADAQQEASELVWKHQNPDQENSAYRNPDLTKGYTQQQRKLSHAQSIEKMASNLQEKIRKKRSSLGSNRSVSASSKGSVSHGSRSSSGSSARRRSDGSHVDTTRVEGAEPVRKTSGGSSNVVTSKRPMTAIPESPQKPIVSPVPMPTKITPTTVMQSETTPVPKEASLVKEEATPVISAPEAPLPPISTAKTAHSAIPMHFRNPFARVKSNRASLTRVSTDPTPTVLRSNTIEIHRNPPSQSRNAAYTSNKIETTQSAPTTPPVADEEPVKMKEGKEIRSDDIRKATSMSLKDRSPRLPQPSMVSDMPGRPIVSFDQNWKPKEVILKEEVSQGSVSKPSPLRRSKNAFAIYEDSDVTSKPVPSLPAQQPSFAASARSSTLPTRFETLMQPAPLFSSRTPKAAAPPIPTFSFNDESAIPSISINNTPTISINVPDSMPPIPSISINESPAASTPSIPTINISPSEQSNTSPTKRPLPNPTHRRPLPSHANSAPAGATPHITPTISARTGGALCTACALPISGRIVTAAGSRFHPTCFRCHTCSEPLECVAFYPEPASSITLRNDRITARANGTLHSDSTTDDLAALSAPNFYCHLDYHELFSPRCKSCKTPIEGEVVIACGAEWHAGHFFCAQCGDPFDERTPFVEKDGFAWCVGCHTNRFSAKCKGCRKPVVEMVVKALGAEWHEACFCCVECRGAFKDGRYFLRPGGSEPVCSACEERRLKA